MLNCKDVQERISAWIDGELDAAECPRMQSHIDSCSCCRGRVEFEKYTKSLLKKKLAPVAVPTGLAERVKTQLQGEHISLSWWKKLWESRLFQPIPLGAALTGLFAICFLTYTYWLAPSSSPNVANWWVCQAAYYCYEADEEGKFKMDYTGTDPVAMIRQVNSTHQRSFSMSLPVFDTQKYQLIGAKYCMLGERPSLYVRFQKDNHLVSMEIIDATGISLPKVKPARKGNLPYFQGTYEHSNVLIYRQNNLLFAITSDLPPKTLKDMVTSHLIQENGTIHCE